MSLPHALRCAAVAVVLIAAAGCGSQGSSASSDIPAPSTPSTTPASPTSDPSVPLPSDTDSPPAPRPGQILKRNPLYRAAAMRDAGCRANSSVPLDSVANVTTYYRSVLPCLHRAWQPVLREAGFPARSAKLQVFSGGNVDTPCGGGLQYSFYCPENETIYMYADEMVQPWNQYPGDTFSHGITKLAAAHTIAHEYSHHVQELTGIFEAASPSAGSPAERRSELQASCLGNVFPSAQRGAYPIGSVYLESRWESLWRFITRVPNHGSENNQRTWTHRGFDAARAGACNTWKSPTAEVG